MEKIKGLFSGGGSKSTEPTDTKSAPPPPPSTASLEGSKAVEMENKAPPPPDSLQEAGERTNKLKQAYDDCEYRRMQIVMKGDRDTSEFSCEREFRAFKEAFDAQLAVESKINPLDKARVNEIKRAG